ncbi:Lactose transport system permease protein LacF [Clostridium sp. C105KSO15]|nr:Lactose transport system permease protein LacF [Clostridium sp. C105KSO15]
MDLGDFKILIEGGAGNSITMTKRKVKNMAMAYLFLLPNLVGFLIFTLIPIVCSMGLSFMEWDSANPMVFVGFENFKRLWTDDTFKISLWNTVYYSVFTVPLTMAAALGLAIILNQKMKGINIFRTIFFFPHVASLVAIAVVWNLLFHPTLGPVNNILRFLGIANPPGWTSSVDWAMPVIIIVSIWKSMGYYMILYLSGLQAIPRELYEAAKVDGANSFQRFKSITLPMLTPTTFFVSIMLTIACFKVFDLVSVMTNGGPGRATNVLVFNIYNTAFINYEFGYASAISMILFIIVLAITIVQFRAEKKWVSYM